MLSVRGNLGPCSLANKISDETHESEKQILHQVSRRGVIRFSKLILAMAASSSLASNGRLGLPFASFSKKASLFPSRNSLIWPVVAQSQSFGIKLSKATQSRSRIIGQANGDAVQSSTTTSQAEALEWVKQDNRRLLHVVYRVGDLDKTIRFYTECLGMKLLRKRDIPEEKYTNAFLGYGPEDSHFVVELTYNYGVDKYDIGTGFGHFGIAVEDVAKTVDLVRAKGGKVTREPGPVKGGKTVIAFVEDPDGYKFEILQRDPTPEPLCQVMLRVGDLDRSIEFYKKAYGMELLRTRDNPEYKYTIAMMGYGPEDKSAVLELTYNYGVKEYEKGNGYAQIAIGTDDVYKTAEVVKLCGGKVTREPGPLPGINTKITSCLDPDGWKTVFVDNIDFAKELE
ncbi:hypothetical protein LUZ61_015348 [Rhynchospora tenuis]|uniref:Lactoylglutathione lyase n=1 Tax=Rhynchospora tenuis TaxID=198213 RepID=A0AAD5Z3K5_9POAL|nr:hypothetical protein LUZ61_015348 [Rhynchospora tenuis]